MPEIVNLNQARKARAKLAKRQQADENAVKFGRKKNQKKLETTRAEKEKRDLDGKERKE